MATGAAVAIGVGTLVGIEGNRRAARDRANAARSNAQLKRLQALELLDRFDINAKQLFSEGELHKAGQQLSQASRGVDVGSSSALSVIEETNAVVARQFILQKREAMFKASQLRSGADIDDRLAGDIQSSNKLQSVGSFLQGVGSIARVG